MGFWILVPGVGMGGGAPETVIDGPYCICAADVWVAGGRAGDAYRAGAQASDVHLGGGTAGQGDCC